MVRKSAFDGLTFDRPLLVDEGLLHQIDSGRVFTISQVKSNNADGTDRIHLRQPHIYDRPHPVKPAWLKHSKNISVFVYLSMTYFRGYYQSCLLPNMASQRVSLYLKGIFACSL